MIFSVFANFDKSDIRAMADGVIKVLSGPQNRVAFHEKYSSLLKDYDCDFLPESELYSVCDIAVVLGGDGTTMKVAKKAAINGKPALGINGGRLGF